MYVCELCSHENVLVSGYGLAVTGTVRKCKSHQVPTCLAVGVTCIFEQPLCLIPLILYHNSIFSVLSVAGKMSESMYRILHVLGHPRNICVTRRVNIIRTVGTLSCNARVCRRSHCQ